MIVVTADQRGSRDAPDRVGELLADLGALDWLAPRLAFERTSGDEVQGVLTDHAAVVRLALHLVRTGGWSVGIGLGPVREPLPSSTRAGAGLAFTRARDAVDRAKRTRHHLAVTGDGDAGSEAEAVLHLVAAVAARRTDEGWRAIDLVESGMTQLAAAEVLGVTKQAVSARLRAALWDTERHVRPVVAGLLRTADR